MATIQEALDQKKKEAAEQAVKERQEVQAAADKEKAQAEEQKQAADEKARIEKLEASRQEQEAQDRKDELAARLAAAQELLAEHGMTPATTPNAGANKVPLGANVPTLTLQPDGTEVSPARGEIQLGGPFRTFQHQYAGAGVIMAIGKRLVFGGPNGGIGYYTTNKPAELELLSEIADTPGSMVTEVKKAADGRYLVVNDPILQAEQLAVQRDSRKNTATDLDPNVTAARQNFGRSIAQNS